MGAENFLSSCHHSQVPANKKEDESLSFSLFQGNFPEDPQDTSAFGENLVPGHI